VISAWYGGFDMRFEAQSGKVFPINGQLVSSGTAQK
jgi:hypothetical protein